MKYFQSEKRSGYQVLVKNMSSDNVVGDGRWSHGGVITLKILKDEHSFKLSREMLIDRLDLRLISCLMITCDSRSWTKCGGNVRAIGGSWLG